jgi:hypothetical protein
VPESNWLPSAAGKGFSLTLQTYVSKDMVKRGEWFPPAITSGNDLFMNPAGCPIGEPATSPANRSVQG